MISVIFVEPESSGNIGSLARVMKNFGLEKMILTNPPELDEEAKKMAMHSGDILERARIFPSLEEAVREFDYVVGTTACLCKHKKIIPLKAFLKKPLPKKSAIVFGRESTGLSNEEKMLCDVLVTIPASKGYSTMNITHAAAIFLYELFQMES